MKVARKTKSAWVGEGRVYCVTLLSAWSSARRGVDSTSFVVVVVESKYVARVRVCRWPPCDKLLASLSADDGPDGGLRDIFVSQCNIVSRHTRFVIHPFHAQGRDGGKRVEKWWGFGCRAWLWYDMFFYFFLVARHAHTPTW